MPYNNNPYNFIPLLDRVYTRYASMEQLPAHDAWEPNRLSGIITCTFTAETPVCVDNGKKDNANDFFRRVDGTYVIPGSSVKGIVRTNMMILGQGALRPGEDLDNVRMLYRAMASAKGSVKELVKLDYEAALDYKNGPPKVSACYVRREGKAFVIYRTAKPFLRVPKRIVPEQNWARYKELCEEAKEQKLRAGKAPKLLPYEYTRIKKEHDLTIVNPICKAEWVNAWTKTFDVWYRASGETVKQMEVRAAGETRTDWSPGVLMAAGDMNGQNTLYLFPAFDETDAHFTWSVEDRLAYEMDYKQRKNTLRGTKGTMTPNFWALPQKQGQAEPFFLLDDQSGGVVVGRTPYLRVAFLHTPGEGVPETHRAAAMELTLDYPYAVLGFASDYMVSDEAGREKKKNFAYRSRVSFEDFQTSAAPSQHIKMSGGGPKPSSFPDYLLDKKSYNHGDFRLRGIKQYWLQPSQVPDQSEIKEKMGTDLTLMEPGTQFTGRIHFRNLSKDELGLLLWCLSLDDGLEEDKTYFQTVGKGKPWGYGRMKVTLDAVEQLCPERLYRADGLASGKYTQPLDANGLIGYYCAYMEQELNRKKPFREIGAIQDFLHMHSVERKHEDVRYLTLAEYKNRRQFMPTVREERKRAKETAAVEDRDTEYRRRKAELGATDLMGTMRLIQEFKQRYPGWTPPQDS